MMILIKLGVSSMKGKCLVVNGKGGVGKSVTSRELLAANLDNAVLYEFDAANLSQKPYSDNKSFKVKCFCESDIDKFIVDDLMDEDKSIIIDIGIENFSDILQMFYDNSLYDFLDVIFIPLNPSCQDSAKNAIKMYRFLETRTDTPIYFVFNKIDSAEPEQAQFQYFFEKADKNKVKYAKRTISLPYCELLVKAQEVSKTLKALSDDTTDYRQKSLDARAAGNKDEALKAIRMDLLCRGAKKFINDQLTPALTMLPTVFKG